MQHGSHNGVDVLLFLRRHPHVTHRFIRARKITMVVELDVLKTSEFEILRKMRCEEMKIRKERKRRIKMGIKQIGRMYLVQVSLFDS